MTTTELTPSPHSLEISDLQRREDKVEALRAELDEARDRVAAKRLEWQSLTLRLRPFAPDIWFFVGFTSGVATLLLASGLLGGPW